MLNVPVMLYLECCIIYVRYIFPIFEYSLVYIPGTHSIWAKVGFFETDIGISTTLSNLDNVFNGFL